MNNRHLNNADRLIMHLDTAVRTLFGSPQLTERRNPADDIEESELSPQEQRHVAGLMRVNHAGEVAAQGLYQGQAITARLPEVRDKMKRAAMEENDHLAWCQKRVNGLGENTSLLNPLWYVGSVAIGAVAGKIGDKWSLGFVAETEHQVVRHLDEHMKQLPKQDEKSRAILEQMKEDESQHATSALDAGGAELPDPIKKLMALTSKVMTKTAYRI